ncbi:zinc ribbon domain-containing protein, partial [Paracoccus litorisediminis]|uniref:zinc ribbon domain-containing protein n=1 Tax=Paracoccus litorisediminis TaxID=2006130 RepID=UPI0037342136
LAYKLEETGGILIKVPAPGTSQECSDCGHADRNSRKSQARFCCTACGFEINADINAARNIRRRGLAGLETYRRGNDPLLDAEATCGRNRQLETLSGDLVDA